ncbi:tail fiber assembly protein, partial [Vibrio cholerae]|nr:tail fiber assembly protein [Vibrio cholerae]
LDGQWVTDTSAQHAAAVSEAETKKISLLAEASTIIAPLSDALAGGYITDEDSKKLLAWQKYRYSLTKVDTSLAEKVVFPVKPDL